MCMFRAHANYFSNFFREGYWGLNLGCSIIELHPQSFLVFYFKTVLLSCPVWPPTCDSPASWATGITGVHYCAQLPPSPPFWDKVSQVPGWPWTCNRPATASQNSGVHHHAWLWLQIFLSEVGWICRCGTYGYGEVTRVTMWSFTQISWLLNRDNSRVDKCEKFNQMVFISFSLF